MRLERSLREEAVWWGSGMYVGYVCLWCASWHAHEKASSHVFGAHRLQPAGVKACIEGRLQHPVLPRQAASEARPAALYCA